MDFFDTKLSLPYFGISLIGTDLFGAWLVLHSPEIEQLRTAWHWSKMAAYAGLVSVGILGLAVGFAVFAVMLALSLTWIERRGRKGRGRT